MIAESLLKIGQTIAKKLALQWLATKKADKRRGLDLSRLIQQQYPARRKERDVLDALMRIEDQVAGNLEREIVSLSFGIPENESEAALMAVSDALGAADLSNEALFSTDFDPMSLEGSIRASFDLSRVGLSSRAERLFEEALKRSCVILLHLLQELPEFDSASAIENLRRFRAMSDRLDSILESLPDVSLDAPRGSGDDDVFKYRYLSAVERSCDRLEVIGLTTHKYEARTTLSVAYLSLSVTVVHGELEANEASNLPFDWTRNESDSKNLADNLRVESALWGSKWTVVRGEAGAGKSTLLRWLAINAARRSFEGKLDDWNDCVPILVKLRDFPDSKLPRGDALLEQPSSPHCGPIPMEWVHRQLSSGKVLLLVDGVDELTKSKRDAARVWLRSILDNYPEIRVVVTSRPTAVSSKWLHQEGFRSVILEPMNPSDISVFLRRWHKALLDSMATSTNFPFTADAVLNFERTLLSQMQSRPHLTSLARNPLLCAMLCALNLDRRAKLPRDRFALYSAALEMLLERRDADRNVASGSNMTLSTTEKTVLIRSLAWWLNENSRSQMTREQALSRLVERLTGMPHVSETAVEILDYLIERSGVIREPVEGKIDFIHRTFQEFLAAQEAVGRDSIDLLVKNAHLDLWRETILMACAQGNERQTGKIIGGILKSSKSVRNRNSRQLLLLAAACKETAITAPVGVMKQLDDRVRDLVPPRSTRESRSLATIGEPVLDYFPQDLVAISSAQAAASIRTAGLVGGPKAMDIISRSRLDCRPGMQKEIANAWRYFDPEEYANRVLSDAPLPPSRFRNDSGGEIDADFLPSIPFLKLLRNLRQCRLNLWTEGNVDSEFDEIYKLDQLNGLTFLSDLLPVNFDRIGSLSRLDRLFVNALRGWPESLPRLSELVSLQTLALVSCDDLKNFTFLNNLPLLESINLHTVRVEEWMYQLANPQMLNEAIVTGIDDTRTVQRFSSRLPSLKSVSLIRCQVADLSVLSTSRISTLNLSSCPNVILETLRDAKMLRHVHVSGIEDVIDLAPLQGTSLLISVGRGTQVRNTLGVHAVDNSGKQINA